MAVLHATFFSDTLRKQVQMNVFTPNKGNGPFPVFYLLHGLSDDYTAWQRWTRLENYLGDLPLVVVMPDGFRGFYCDHVDGPKFATYMPKANVATSQVSVKKTAPGLIHLIGKLMFGATP